MLKELQKKMMEFHMISQGDVILAGVSGGADSVCLLFALLELQKEMGFSLEVVHVEHGIRGEESKKDAAFVEKLCQQYQIICHTIEVDVPAYCEKLGLGMEEAARILRYQAFAKLAKEKGAKIALAHHKEDNAETILFQMVRGSSLAGVCGMQPMREDENGVCYIRPLLFFRREEIEVFLKSKGMDWCVDSTNAQMEYSRNFLRKKVIPELERINSQAIEHMNQTASHLSEIKAYLDSETERVWEKITRVEGKIALDANALVLLHPVMQKQIAYKAIVTMAKQKKDITSTHVEDLIHLCNGQSGKKIALPYGMVAWKEFEIVYVAFGETRDKDVIPEEHVYEISAECIEQLFHSGKEEIRYIGNSEEKLVFHIFKQSADSLEIPRKTYTKWFDYDMIKDGFCIRTRRSGDYFISDRLGHRKKLKSYFIDEKIPLGERSKKWLLTQGNEVLWLIGGRMSEHVKVSQETKYIFEITYDGGNENG